MDGLLLVAVVEEARRALLGATLTGVQPAGLHGLWLELTTPRGPDSLLLEAGEVLPRLARGAPRPPRTRTLSPLAGVARRLLPGAALQGLTHRGLDRVVTLEFGLPPPAGGGCRLVAELFGRHPNLVLVDGATGRILEAARRGAAPGNRSLAPDATYVGPPPAGRPDPRALGDPESLGAVLVPQVAAGLAPRVILRQGLAGLTDLWAQEVAARSGNGGATDLARALLALLREVEAGPWQPHLVLDGAGRPVAASPVRLHHLPDERQRPCPSLGNAVGCLAEAQAQRHALAARQTALRQVLRRLETRLRTRRAKLADESLEFARADVYRRMGEVLVAHQGAVPRGATEVTLPDHAAGPQATVTIPLDPALPPAANAQRLFNAARRGRRGALRVAGRLAETEAELGRVQAWIQRVAEAQDPAVLEAVQAELEARPRLLAPQDRATLAGPALLSPRPGPRPPAGRAERGAPGRGGGPEPRRFVSSDGFPILVGRSTEGNDYLTQHLSRSEDLWLHVQGRSGSHVVVRTQKRPGGIPRRTLIQAAQLAAYYSQARDEGKVAVDYTLRKYVRKPRKAKPGLVTITQEKTIIVTPDKSLVAKLAPGEE